ncbi:MAG: divalent cation tolerance protein CutA, partial [Azonexus sp.]
MPTLLVLTNCPDEESANAIALALVEERLAACV